MLSKRKLVGIVLVTILTSCAEEAATPEEPANRPTNSVNTDIGASVESATPFATSKDIGELTIDLESDFERLVVVRVRNTSQAAIELPPNFSATSRVLFFDERGEVIESGGFEGRPVQGAHIPIGEDQSYTSRYSNSMFIGQPILTAHRICFRAQTSTSSSERLRMCISRS